MLYRPVFLKIGKKCATTPDSRHSCDRTHSVSKGSEATWRPPSRSTEINKNITHSKLVLECVPQLYNPTPFWCECALEFACCLWTKTTKVFFKHLQAITTLRGIFDTPHLDVSVSQSSLIPRWLRIQCKVPMWSVCNKNHSTPTADAISAWRA